MKSNVENTITNKGGKEVAAAITTKGKGKVTAQWVEIKKSNSNSQEKLMSDAMKTASSPQQNKLASSNPSNKFSILQGFSESGELSKEVSEQDLAPTDSIIVSAHSPTNLSEEENLNPPLTQYAGPIIDSTISISPPPQSDRLVDTPSTSAAVTENSQRIQIRSHSSMLLSQSQCQSKNVRGLNSREKQHDIKNFLNNILSPIVCLVETKVDQLNADRISENILPHYSLLIPLHGGRIWILWQPALIKVELLASSSQFMHCKVTPMTGQQRYFLSAIYASNLASERLSLWQDLRGIAHSIAHAQWLIGEDFNEVRFCHEKQGSNLIHSRRMTRFNDCITDCHLNNLRAMGRSFSWSNNQDQRIVCKLDRVLVNLAWLHLNTNSYVQSLPAGLSDHTPLHVIINPPSLSGPRPFKYFSAWESHPELGEVIHKAWRIKIRGSSMFILAKKLHHLKIVLKDWNKEVFGPIQSSLQLCRERLESLQNAALLDPTNSNLMDLEREAKEHYLIMLRREESFLRQKSRQLWLSEGDRNSKFFYSSIKSRIAKNTIRKVMLPDGTSSKDPSFIKDFVVEYFKKLLNTSASSLIPKLDNLVPITSLEGEAMCAPVSEAEEIAATSNNV
ncbi:hypothetical protein QJS10_CPA09g01039 [Acorus calamus]|uniref:Endonuclease/exonuclease/phosphatase domain-containing protein n=1 Tax=Acorus calamus TaxID=4465 RepID=A0AAV9E8U7_ACOCL|nr:hypothetical protein QJS10_CPA09g01039 [Acorus calamus]